MKTTKAFDKNLDEYCDEMGFDPEDVIAHIKDIAADPYQLDYFAPDDDHPHYEEFKFKAYIDPYTHETTLAAESEDVIMAGVDFEGHTILDFQGWDSWDRPVYRVYDGSDDSVQYAKDVDLGDSFLPSLHWSCPRDNPDGEPDWPLDTDKEIRFTSTKGLPLPENASRHNQRMQEKNTSARDDSHGADLDEICRGSLPGSEDDSPARPIER